MRRALLQGLWMGALGLAAAPMAAWALTPPPPPPATEGEVRRVDAENGKISIKHGEIKHLDMPPMSMVFPVRDKALLDNVKPGDKVKFMVEKDAAGKLIVTDIQPVR